MGTYMNVPSGSLSLARVSVCGYLANAVASGAAQRVRAVAAWHETKGKAHAPDSDHPGASVRDPCE